MGRKQTLGRNGWKADIGPVAFAHTPWPNTRMKPDLIELLNQREIVHPTRIVAVEAGHRQLRITIAGYPWWRATEREGDAQVVFSFEGVEEGLLDAETLLDMEDDEALEFFNVSPLPEQGWAYSGTSYATYCSEPLPEPLKLYALVDDYLLSVGAPRSARDYLNAPDRSVARFCKLATSSSYLLAEAPEQLHQMILTELLRQGVTHNVIASERPANQGLFVQMGGSCFVCRSATAEM